MDGTLEPGAVAAAGGYIKPAGGIPKTDLDAALQASVTSADTALQPGVSAGGDLAGSYPSPTVTKLNGVAISGTPSTGQALIATGATTASWSALPSTGMAFQGQWNSSTNYAIGSVVIRPNYGLYVCTATNTNQDPAGSQPVFNSFSQSLWQTNGTATNDGTTVTLTTDSQTASAASIIYKTALASQYVDVTFSTSITSGGTPADGFGFAVLDATANSTSALGTGAVNVGLVPRPSILAVRFTTYSNNYIQVTSTDGFGNATNYGSVGFNSTGNHTWRIIFAPIGSAVSVTVFADGNQVLVQSGIITSVGTCYAAFGAGTGGSAENALLTSPTLSQLGTSAYWTKIAIGV